MRLPGNPSNPADLNLSWDNFFFMFNQYNFLANVSGDAASHLLDFMSQEALKILFATHGQTLNNQTEAVLISNIKRLVVT